MAIAGRLGPDGRPIDEGFFGLGNALAQLPGTPVLPGAGGGNAPGMPGDAFQNYTPPGPGSLGENGTGWGAGPSPAPAPGGPPMPPEGGYPGGAPPPNPVSGVTQPGQSFFGGTNPFQSGVTGTVNNQTVPFASERYVTPEAAQRLGSLLGANVVSQNTEGMSSPGSGAPSQPMLGLDFGRGDVQDASMGAFQAARGDRPEDIAARYQAGLNTKAWAGDNPIPQLAENWDAPYWNRSNPVSTNTPNPQQAGFFGPQSGQGDQTAFFNWLRGQLGGQG